MLYTTGGHPKCFGEAATEMGEVFETNFQRNFRYVEVGGFEQDLCFAQTQVPHILVNRQIGKRIKFSVQLRPAHGQCLAKLRDAEVFIAKVGFQDFPDFLHKRIFLLNGLVW